MFELWTEAVRSIEPLVKPAHRDRWLRPIQCVGISEGEIRLRAPDRYHKEWFEDNYLPSILKDLEDRAHRSFQVVFEIDQETGGEIRSETESLEGDRPSTAPTPGLSFPQAPSAKPTRPDLIPRFTFDQFVVGPTNQFAHAAARMVGENPASRWNPLFICGGVGLGKTHLLHAIGHEIHRQHPDWSIAFVTCERFVNDLISSIHQRRPSGVNPMEEFRIRYREKPDVLLVDDVQFLSHKDSSQDEFFHTFNALHYAHKQIVLTADKLPQEIPGVADRLKSRFTWGLITEVDPPDLETRVAILRRKAEQERVELPDEVAHYLGAHIKSNVRELEGALLRLAARATFQNRAIDMALAQAALEGFVAKAPSGLTIEAIQREVAAYFDVKLVDLKGTKRHRAVAQPRAVAMYLARKLTAMSYPEIGSRFGGKDHSTVITAVRKIERQCGEDPGLRGIVGTLEARLRQN